MKAILELLPKRLIIIALTLWLLSLMVFGMTQVLPGDAASMVLGQWATDESLSKLRQELGLDRSIWIQYKDWLVRFMQGDFGKSLTLQLPIKPMVMERLMNSMELGLLAFAEITLLGILLGVLCGVKKDSLFDQIMSTAGFIAVSIPEFVSGSLLILLFAGGIWKVFPASGHVPLSDGFWPWLSRLILPSTALTMVLLAYVMRMTRSSLVDVLQANYVRTARLKGLSEARVIVFHALRNALLPTVTLLAFNFGWLLGGIVVVESVFSYPGLGRLVILSIEKRDFPIIQASVLVVAIIYLFANLVADLLYMIVDPRTRSQSS